jgi:hypothetical protein
VVAFVLSALIAVVLCGGIVAYSKRRPAGTPTTWGEAMLGAMIVFFVFFWVYGVVPHQWLTWADNELQWRADRTFVGWGGFLEPEAEGGWLPLTITYQVIRDIVAVMIYVVALAGNMMMWKMWQTRGSGEEEKAPERSTFGRPIVKEGARA